MPVRGRDKGSASIEVGLVLAGFVKSSTPTGTTPMNSKGVFLWIFRLNPPSPQKWYEQPELARPLFVRPWVSSVRGPPRRWFSFQFPFKKLPKQGALKKEGYPQEKTQTHFPQDLGSQLIRLFAGPESGGELSALRGLRWRRNRCGLRQRL